MGYSRDRFVVGSYPTYPVRGLHGESRVCQTAFPSSDVVGADERLLKAGWFRGTCDRKPLGLWFEAVEAGHIAVAVQSRPIALPAYELDSKQPERGTSFLVQVFDRCGNKLKSSPGRESRWTFAPTCTGVVRADNPGQFPLDASDYLAVAPVGAGTCEITVAGYGHSARVTLKVH